MVNSCAMSIEFKDKGIHSSLTACPTRVKQGETCPNRVRWYHLVTIMAAFSALAACAPSTETLSSQQILPTRTPAPLPTLTPLPTSPPQQIVSIWLDWEYAELQGLFEVIERYQEQHPAAEFEITYYTRDQLLETFETAAAIGEGPSILFGPSSWGPSLREQRFVLNLSPLLDPGMETDVHPIAWTQAAEGTQLFGLPLELHGFVLYRNRSLAAQPVSSVEEWLQIADQMKLENRSVIALDLDLEISLPMMAACGEDIFNLRGELMVFDQGGECWLDLLSRLGDLGTVVFSSDEELKSFKSGQTAWVIASTALRDDLIEAIGVTNLKVDPWPLYESEGFPLRGFTWSENAYLVAGSTESDLEASWKFIQFLFGNEGQEILSDPSGAAHIPTTSVTEPPDSLMLESSSMLRAGIPIPLKSNLDIVREPILSAIQAVVMQGADPNFALRMAEERLELLLSSSLTD
jgi:ABC-type glycerol-3-phosphate transport system substrate-binding protein